MDSIRYISKDDVTRRARDLLGHNLRELLNDKDIDDIEKKIGHYNLRRKGYLGELVEKYFFQITPGNISEADFREAKVELKTTPIKESAKRKFVAKERLVFSMINYENIIHETWEDSSFLKKNSSVLILFYLWKEIETIIDYKFKFMHFLDFKNSIPDEDLAQIKRDWEYIVNKIREGKAHLLSEGDTFYLGACTKSANSFIVRDQPLSKIKAKPRAFSLKQQYVNFLINNRLLSGQDSTNKLEKNDVNVPVEKLITDRLSKFQNKTDIDIQNDIDIRLNKKNKSYKRMLALKMIGAKSNKIEELQKANITLRVITLEHTGTLRESISFPSFDYTQIIDEAWGESGYERMSTFHEQLETNKFLFVVFQKEKNSNLIRFKKAQFWNFPMNDILEAKRVWEYSVRCIGNGDYKDLPGIRFSNVAHVRPHGRNANDKIKTPQGTYEVKRSFWLNAKYIERALK
ncbi:MAG TPA: Sau3AI family type II restriction endonuclease [Candidatus Saccharibacteria bacterium]|nr:Sau3AI family type II restriction endonuclease [Candidatus Saccharibacteria bacterium]HMT55471.1 Sau3AI family type II restriction endonuclease [Candidatus Saccharibacteria bacterium]